jgi:hypothetical protein
MGIRITNTRKVAISLIYRKIVIIIGAGIRIKATILFFLNLVNSVIICASIVAAS